LHPDRQQRNTIVKITEGQENLRKDRVGPADLFCVKAGPKLHLLFFSFFNFLFSLRLSCGAFLLSLSPLLFSFITPSFPIPVSSRYAYARRSDKKVSIFTYVLVSKERVEVRQYLTRVHSVSLPSLSNLRCRYSPLGGGDTKFPPRPPWTRDGHTPRRQSQSRTRPLGFVEAPTLQSCPRSFRPQRQVPPAQPELPRRCTFRCGPPIDVLGIGFRAGGTASSQKGQHNE